jgi:hypothetical protein
MQNNDGLDFAPSTAVGGGTVIGGGTGSPNGLTGTVSISNSTITGSADNNAVISDTSGTLSLTVTGSTISSNSTSNGNAGILVDANAATSATVSITGSTFTNNRGDHFHFVTDTTASGTNSVTFSNNTLTSSSTGVAPGGGDAFIDPGGSSSTTITVEKNNVQFPDAVSSSGIFIASTQTATVSGHIASNTVGTATVAGSGSGDGIHLAGEDSSTETLAITGNSLYQYANFAGIYFIDRQSNSAAGPTMNLTITGNTIADPAGNATNGGAWGILGEGGGQLSDSGKLCAAISGNSLTGSGQTSLGSSDIELDQTGKVTYELPGYTGGSTDTTAVQTFLAGNNTPMGGTAPNVIATVNGGGFSGGTSCPAPS